MLVQGPPGIGKTALITALDRLAREAGRPIRSVRGTELAQDLSYGAAGALLGTAIDPDGPPIGDFARLQQLFDTAVALTDPAGSILVADDAQWIDPPTLRFLAFLAAKIRSTRIALVVTTRLTTDPVRQPILDEIRSGSGVLVLTPQPLSRPGADALLAGRFPTRPEAGFSAVCFRETAGNPLVLGELAAAMTAAELAPVAANAHRVLDIGAHVVAHRVRAQLAGLSADETAVLDAVAVLGDGATRPHLQALATGVALDSAVPALVRAGLVRGDPDRGIEFVHPLIRAAVYESIDPAARARAHQQAAQLLAQADAGPETVAAHYVAVPSGSAPTAGAGTQDAVLLRAADEATRRGSPESALRYLRRALALAPPVDRRARILTAAARVAFQVDLPSAADYLEQLLEYEDDPDTRIELAGTLVATLLLTGRVEQALPVVERERDRLPAAARFDDLRVYLDSCRAMIAVNAPDTPGLATELSNLLQRKPSDGFGGRTLDGVLALYQASRAEPDAVQRAIRAVSDGVRLTGEGRGGPVPIAVNVLLLADRPEGLPELDRAVVRSRDQGSLLAASGAYAYRAHGRLLRGDLAGAHDDARTARWSTSVLGLRNRSFVASVMAATCLHQGRIDDAQDVLDWSELAGAPADRPFTYFALNAFSALHRHRGDPDEALRYARLAGDRFERGGGVNPAQVPWRSAAALALHDLGRAEEAIEPARQELVFARKWGAPRALGRALRVLAVVTGESGLLDEAVQRLRPSIARLELAQCLLARAVATGNAADRADGLELARACGALPLIAAAG